MQASTILLVSQIACVVLVSYITRVVYIAFVKTEDGLTLLVNDKDAWLD